tara:strand:+ start:4766 stop:5812 length:1047 start_codon:yes stop_codon:yes gene_type:complete
LNNPKNILIAPLDWGLGHATRCVPLIEQLLLRDHQVFTCGNKDSEVIFKEHFPSLQHIPINGYNVRYSKGNKQGLSMLVQAPKFFKKIYFERKIAEQLSSRLKLDYIISDNRFGFRARKTTNIFITHQIHIQGPKLLTPLFLKINLNYINKFKHCWIPDYKNNKLSGILTDFPLPNNSTFIGPLSRFKKPAKINQNFKYKYLGIVSGPEPQRTLFEKLLIKEFSKENAACAVIGGNLSKSNYTKRNISYFPHLKTNNFYTIINESENIICRPGYSNIMDLSILNKKAFVIPTPGQTEQEYLAKYHNKKSSVKFCKQNSFTINNKTCFNKFQPFKHTNLLSSALKEVGL